jgi:hypothetical protein
MFLRLIVILALVFQPLAHTWGAAPCRQRVDVPATTCCQDVAPCCPLSSLFAAEVHHCGATAALCRCNSSGPEQPTEPPTSSSRSQPLNAAILPRILFWTVPSVDAAPARMWPQVCHVLHSGRELLAFRCLLLT